MGGLEHQPPTVKNKSMFCIKILLIPIDINYLLKDQTSSASGRLEQGRVVVLSLFILPPAELMLLGAGVLDRG